MVGRSLKEQSRLLRWLAIVVVLVSLTLVMLGIAEKVLEPFLNLIVVLVFVDYLRKKLTQ